MGRGEVARPGLPNKAPTARPAVRGLEKAAIALKMSGAPLPRARNVTPWHREQSRNLFFQGHAAEGHAADAGQGYSHVVGKVQTRADGREVGAETAEGENDGQT